MSFWGYSNGEGKVVIGPDVKWKDVIVVHKIYLKDILWEVKAVVEKDKNVIVVDLNCYPDRLDTLWTVEATLSCRACSDEHVGVLQKKENMKLTSLDKRTRFVLDLAEFKIDLRSARSIKREKIKVHLRTDVHFHSDVTDDVHGEFDLLNPSDKADRVLVVDGKKLYVNSAYLALHSFVFERMFNGEYLERDQKEVPITEATFEEMQSLLSLIFPPMKFKIEESNAYRLLELGHRFDMQVVINKCVQFLDHCLSKFKRLLWATRLRLPALQTDALESLLPDELSQCRRSDEWGEFSEEIRHGLLLAFVKAAKKRPRSNKQERSRVVEQLNALCTTLPDTVEKVRQQLLDIEPKRDTLQRFLNTAMWKT